MITLLSGDALRLWIRNNNQGWQKVHCETKFTFEHATELRITITQLLSNDIEGLKLNELTQGDIYELQARNDNNEPTMYFGHLQLVRTKIRGTRNDVVTVKAMFVGRDKIKKPLKLKNKITLQEGGLLMDEYHLHQLPDRDRNNPEVIKTLSKELNERLKQTLFKPL